MRVADPNRGPHILDTAARLFAQRHYHEVRMDDIALKAGVAKGTLYRYFEDKEDLYLALILGSTDRLLAELKEGLRDVPHPEEQVLLYVQRSIDFFTQFPYFFDLVQRVEMSGTPAKLARLQAARQGFFEFITDIIARLPATGRYRVPDRALAALTLTGMTRQVLRFYPQPWPVDLARRLTQQFLHGLRPRKAGAGKRRPAAVN